VLPITGGLEGAVWVSAAWRRAAGISVATVKTSTFEKCVITGAINYVKS
jgi:hypothetical protein